MLLLIKKFTLFFAVVSYTSYLFGQVYVVRKDLDSAHGIKVFEFNKEPKEAGLINTLRWTPILKSDFCARNNGCENSTHHKKQSVFIVATAGDKVETRFSDDPKENSEWKEEGLLGIIATGQIGVCTRGDIYLVGSDLEMLKDLIYFFKLPRGLYKTFKHCKSM